MPKKKQPKVKKCAPFVCSIFKRMFERIWDKKVPADRIITNCPYRKGLGITCTKTQSTGK